jgi:hypothetical protein
MKIYNKPKTLTITLRKENEKTRTLSIILDNENTIDTIKHDVDNFIIQPLKNESKYAVSIQYRITANQRAGSTSFKTTHSVDDVYNKFISISK